MERDRQTYFSACGIEPIGVDPTRMYRKDEVLRLMKWRPAAWRAALHAGLRTHRSGKNVYVMGSALIEHVCGKAAD